MDVFAHTRRPNSRITNQRSTAGSLDQCKYPQTAIFQPVKSPRIPFYRTCRIRFWRSRCKEITCCLASNANHTVSTAPSTLCSTLDGAKACPAERRQDSGEPNPVQLCPRLAISTTMLSFYCKQQDVGLRDPHIGCEYAWQRSPYTRSEFNRQKRAVCRFNRGSSGILESNELSASTGLLAVYRPGAAVNCEHLADCCSRACIARSASISFTGHGNRDGIGVPGHIAGANDAFTAIGAMLRANGT
jgi:hypothetical protein